MKGLRRVILHLTRLPIADALALVQRRLDDAFARELTDDGLDGNQVDAMLDRQRAEFTAWREELWGRLIACDLLMPSVAKH